jgi:pyroglutamyl-peptidase
LKTVLLAGFGPFGQDPINAALEAVRSLDGLRLADHDLVARELPVVRHECLQVLKALVFEFQPSIVVALGQAEGRSEITPERVAINVDDFRIPDNRGAQPRDEAVIPGGPVAYWSTLPIKAMTEAMCRGGIAAKISNTAGTYVCNHLFYGLMHFLATEGARRIGGLVHVPLLPGQASRHPGMPGMCLEATVRGLELGLRAVLDSADGRLEQ